MVNINGKNFELLIDFKAIELQTLELAEKIDADFSGKPLNLLIVLKGAYRFGAMLTYFINQVSEIHFVTINSYKGTKSTGELQVGNFPNVASNSHWLVIEDIVETGLTAHFAVNELIKKGADVVKCATLLHKPNQAILNFKPDYVGFTIEPAFVVGFGLDYNEKGRELNNIYKLTDTC